MDTSWPHSRRPYAVGLICAGALIDRLGTRVGYALAIGHMERRSDESCAGAYGFGVWSRAILAGSGRVGQFSRRHQDGRGMVSAARRQTLATGIFNAGSNIGAIIAALMVPFVALKVGMAVRVSRNGRPERRMDRTVAERLSGAQPASHGFFSGARPHQKRSAGLCDKNSRGCSCSDTGRPGRLSLPKFMTDPIWWFFNLLVAEVFEWRVRSGAHRSRAAAHCHLLHGRRRQRSGRVACRALHSSRLVD